MAKGIIQSTDNIHEVEYLNVLNTVGISVTEQTGAMMEIFLYAVSVMYSPGPVNFMGLNAGLTGNFKKTVGFFIGVGFAMFTLFLLFGYTGEAVISHRYLPYIALAGAIYTFYLALKMMTSYVGINGSKEATRRNNLTFWNGFFIQALNPKGMLVVLPITTVMYPSSHITGSMILTVSALISVGGAGAPGIYSFIGSVLGERITNEKWFNRLNRLMGLMLISAGVFMAYDFLIGVNLM
ncbi:LysE family translocator [Prodigiosinella confusarubida]|uniref:LysE family translocator n=1 Tax=Serratia sp. (strain ATCC 39006) TaxID=104623 RepID=UPI000424FEBA|nr:LysE family transporter [Serratia sp. ATCC 39006]